MAFLLNTSNIMRYLGIFLILVSIIPRLTSYAISGTEKTTWKLYEVTPTEREQVSLLRTMLEGYPMEVAINGEIREDETAFFLMKTRIKRNPLLMDVEDLQNEKPAKKKFIPTKDKENIFGVYGGDVSPESASE